jgi:aminoglycoside phosphotransferase (APT) family kinase protein
MPFDPTSADAVSSGLIEWIDRHVEGGNTARLAAAPQRSTEGMSTHLWFVQLAGELPAEWLTPLVLRIHPTPSDADVARREAAVMQHVGALGFPVPAPFAMVTDGSFPALPLPWLVMPRVGSGSMLSLIAAKPWRAFRHIDALAELMVALHRLPPEGPAGLHHPDAHARRWLAAHMDSICAVSDGAAEVAQRLLHLLPRVVAADTAICHGDLHPMNVVGNEGGPGDARYWVIDWTESTVGDPHFDVGRTTAVLRVVFIVGEGRAQRAVLRVVGPILARRFERSYRRLMPLDRNQLRFWQAAHLARGAAQLAALEPATGSPNAAGAASRAAALQTQLLRRASTLVAAVSGA